MHLVFKEEDLPEVIEKRMEYFGKMGTIDSVEEVGGVYVVTYTTRIGKYEIKYWLGGEGMKVEGGKKIL